MLFTLQVTSVYKDILHPTTSSSLQTILQSSGVYTPVQVIQVLEKVKLLQPERARRLTQDLGKLLQPERARRLKQDLGETEITTNEEVNKLCDMILIDVLASVAAVSTVKKKKKHSENAVTFKSVP